MTDFDDYWSFPLNIAHTTDYQDIPRGDSTNPGWASEWTGDHPSDPLPGHVGGARTVKRREWKDLLESAKEIIIIAQNYYSEATSAGFGPQLIFPKLYDEVSSGNYTFARDDNWLDWLNVEDIVARRLLVPDPFWELAGYLDEPGGLGQGTRGSGFGAEEDDENFDPGGTEMPALKTVHSLLHLYNSLYLPSLVYNLQDTELMDINSVVRAAPADGEPGCFACPPLGAGVLPRINTAIFRMIIRLVREELELRYTEIIVPGQIQEQMLDSLWVTIGDEDIEYLTNNSVHQQYFSTTFNTEIVGAVPIIQNFYLTTQHFQGIHRAFGSTKNRVIKILASVLQSDDGQPNLGRPAANRMIASSNGPDPESPYSEQSREFILKAILETPINILKGLVELIDPHLNLTKLIKVGTSKAFGTLVDAYPTQEAVQNINTLRQQGLNEEQLKSFKGITGEDFVSLVLCLVDQGLQVGDNAIQNTGAADNFFPRISLDSGVDFTGTVSGMLMIPPTPFGIFYLLLELLRLDLDALANQNVADEGDPSDCAEGSEGE